MIDEKFFCALFNTSFDYKWVACDISPLVFFKIITQNKLIIASLVTYDLVLNFYRTFSSMIRFNHSLITILFFKTFYALEQGQKCILMGLGCMATSYSFFVNAIKKSQLNYFSVSLVIYVGVPPVRMSSINSSWVGQWFTIPFSMLWMQKNM